eukprot:362602-Chlamydomonas_euryale.AAC.2
MGMRLCTESCRSKGTGSQNAAGGPGLRRAVGTRWPKVFCAILLHIIKKLMVLLLRFGCCIMMAVVL